MGIPGSKGADTNIIKTMPPPIKIREHNTIKYAILASAQSRKTAPAISVFRFKDAFV